MKFEQLPVWHQFAGGPLHGGLRRFSEPPPREWLVPIPTRITAIPFDLIAASWAIPTMRVGRYVLYPDGIYYWAGER